MPELPEVETIRRQLDKEFSGKRIKSVEVTGTRSIRRHANKKQFISRLEGKKLMGVVRRGKNLLIGLEGGDQWVVHLGMSGQLVKATAREAPVKHTHVVVAFTQGPQLRFIDPRTFGETFVVSAEDEVDIAPELRELGFDPVEEPISWTDFAHRLLARKGKLKPILMDQKFVAGVGNIYSDEILWEAGLRYDRSTETLSTQEIRRLYRALVEVLHEAIKHRGSSLPDEQYVDLYGNVGGFQELHKVHNRAGLACERCRQTIEKVKLSGRSAYYCPGCQE